MSDNHGNTPAAWAAVVVALLGFIVAGVGLMFDPVSCPVFWVGVAITVDRGVVFVVMARMGLDGEPLSRALRPVPSLLRRHPADADASARCSPSARWPLATLALHYRDPHQHGSSWGFCPSTR